MKSFNDAAMAEIEAGTAIVVAAVEIACATPVRVWQGELGAEIMLGGEEFVGLGDVALIKGTSGAIGAADQNITLTLSGIDPKALELLDADEVQAAPVTIWRLVFKGNGKTLLDAHVFKRGRVDQVPTSETIGGPAEIGVLIETAARGLGRRSGRMRSDADQRLVKPNDGFFRKVSFAGEQQLYWGGTKPASAGTALGGVGGGGGGLGPSPAERRLVARD